MTTPFPMIEMAVKELVEEKYPASEGKIGGDPDVPAAVDLYVMLNLVPGGSANQIEGEFILDIDVFSASYADAMTAALAIEAGVVGPRHVTSIMRLDNCYENLGPAERPWDDDATYRVGATYVFTARRPSSA